MWKSTSESLPPIGQLVETKVDDEYGLRYQQQLVRYGEGKKKWRTTDGSYIYYRPTHWKEVTYGN